MSGSDQEPAKITVDKADLLRLYEALDDLWGCIGTAEIDSLQPETLDVAREVHTAMWHSDTTTGSK